MLQYLHKNIDKVVHLKHAQVVKILQDEVKLELVVSDWVSHAIYDDIHHLVIKIIRCQLSEVDLEGHFERVVSDANGEQLLKLQVTDFVHADPQKAFNIVIVGIHF